jgi:tetratricopeptide (TPR) repeat protein
LLSGGNLATWIAIIAATFAAYWPALRGGLVWDDTSHVTPPQLQSLHGLWRIWFDLGATQQYYPLLHSAFWIEHHLWGDAVLGYHLTNVAQHALAACLVVLIVRRLGLPGAWLAGLIFALHPVCVEAVAWISEQKSTLSGLFYLASGLIYLRFDRTRRKSDYAWALTLFVLALLSKTVTATLPPVLLVIFWWQRGRLGWHRDVRPLLPWFVIGAGSGLFTAWVERTYIGAGGATYSLTLGQRLLLAGRIICFYAGKLVWPSNLIFTYPRWLPDLTVWRQYLYPLAVGVVWFAFWRVAKRHRGPLASFLIFVGTLFPVLGFLNVYPFRYSYVADHFQYLAALGVIVPAASMLVGWTQRQFPANKNVPAVLVVLPAILAGLTWRQSGMYRDAETLYRTTLARNASSWMAHNNLGVVLLHAPGRLPDAIAEFQAALQINPDDAQAHSNLATALSRVPDRLPDAIAEYQTALQIQPTLAEAHTFLGMALARVPGRLPEAIAEYQTALDLQPNDPELHNLLGVAMAQTPGGMGDAIAQFRAALALDPKLAKAHNNLGRSLAETPSGLPEAIIEYQAALRLQPDYAEAHNNLGIALAQTPGRMEDAVAEFQLALRAQPDYIHARINLGNALAQIPGRRQEALAQYELVLQSRPDLDDVRQLIKQLQAGK